MQNKRQVLLRPQRQSGRVDNLRFHLYLLSWEEDGGLRQLILSGKEGFVKLLEPYFLYSGVGFPAWLDVRREGRGTVFILLHRSITGKLVLVPCPAGSAHVPVLPAAASSLPPDTSGAEAPCLHEALSD